MVNKCWMAALALGVKTKAVLSVLKCEWRREFQSHVLAVELSEVWEVLSVELISLDMRYRLAEWKRLWWTVCNKPWWPPANPHTAAPSYQSTANEWNSAQSPLYLLWSCKVQKSTTERGVIRPSVPHVRSEKANSLLCEIVPVSTLLICHCVDCYECLFYIDTKILFLRENCFTNVPQVFTTGQWTEDKLVDKWWVMLPSCMRFTDLTPNPCKIITHRDTGTIYPCTCQIGHYWHVTSLTGHSNSIRFSCILLWFNILVSVVSPNKPGFYPQQAAVSSGKALINPL